MNAEELLKPICTDRLTGETVRKRETDETKEEEKAMRTMKTEKLMMTEKTKIAEPVMVSEPTLNPEKAPAAVESCGWQGRKAGCVYRLIAALMCVIFLMVPMQAFAGGTLYWPVPSSRNITQGLHGGNAIDIGAAIGTPVVAAQSGTVTHIWKCTQTHYNYGDCNGFGTGLVILGDDGRAYQYAHMQAGSIPANVYHGARVNAGQQIGCVGQTGYAYGPHLHFGIAYNSQYWTAGPNPEFETYIYSPIDVTKECSIGNQKAELLSYTNAKLSATFYKKAGINASSCGIYLGESESSMVKKNTEAVGSPANNCRGGASFDIWYDLTSELGITLKKSTTYYYKFYVIVDGKEITGATASFKTGPALTKKAQSLKVTPGSKTYKVSTLKKKARTFTLKITGAKGTITRKSSNTRYVTVSGNKVTVKKGTPKGTYKVTVRAAGTSKYKAASKTITIKVKK